MEKIIPQIEFSAPSNNRDAFISAALHRLDHINHDLLRVMEGMLMIISNDDDAFYVIPPPPLRIAAHKRIAARRAQRKAATLERIKPKRDRHSTMPRHHVEAATDDA